MPVPNTPSAMSEPTASRLGAPLGGKKAATGAAISALAAIVAATMADRLDARTGCA